MSIINNGNTNVGKCLNMCGMLIQKAAQIYYMREYKVYNVLMKLQGTEVTQFWGSF